MTEREQIISKPQEIKPLTVKQMVTDFYEAIYSGGLIDSIKRRCKLRPVNRGDYEFALDEIISYSQELKEERDLSLFPEDTSPYANAQTSYLDALSQFILENAEALEDKGDLSVDDFGPDTNPILELNILHRTLREKRDEMIKVRYLKKKPEERSGLLRLFLGS